MMVGETRVLRYFRGIRQARGMCLRCRHWRAVHTTDYAPGRGVFALCTRCHETLTPAERVQYYRRRFDGWMRGLSAGDARAVEIAAWWPLIEAAVRDGQ